jgi:hypothetical protein
MLMHTTRSYRAAPMVLALLIWMAAPALAQDASVRGAVRDSSGNALRGVTITLLPEGGSAARTVQTDDQGGYGFDGLREGVYRVRFELSGYQMVERRGLRLASGVPATLNIRMERSQ